MHLGVCERAVSMRLLVAWWLAVYVLTPLSLCIPLPFTRLLLVQVLTMPIFVGALLPALLLLCAFFTREPRELQQLAAPQLEKLASQGSIGPPSPREPPTPLSPAGESICVVDVQQLSAALQARPAREVLLELSSPAQSALIFKMRISPGGAAERCRTGSCTTFALVSYRQCRLSPDDGTTLDEAALRSVASVAAAANIDAVWLDAWCYRRPGEYVHGDFVKTLAAIAECMSCVIWLPRARVHAPPDYQFRLWTTFEATMVAQRDLKVHVAGVGPTASQLWLKRLGSFVLPLPGVRPPAEVAMLAWTNLAMLAAAIALPPIAPFVWSIGHDDAQLTQLCPQLGFELQLARSGQRVLRALAGTSGGGDRASGGTSSGGNKLVALLRKGLPWLPAYDRRDALTVKAILDRLQTAPMASAHATLDDRALALSAYVSAMLRPSAGDAVGGRNLRAWLSEKRVPLPPSPAASATATAEAAYSDLNELRVPLGPLAHFGWLWRRGATSILSTPAGLLAAPTPTAPPNGRGGAWDGDRFQPLVTPVVSPAVAFAAFYLSIPTGVIAMLVVRLLHARASVDGVWSAAGQAHGLGVAFAIWSSGFLVWGLGISAPLCASVSSQVGRAPNHPDLLYPLQPCGHGLLAFAFSAAQGLAFNLFFAYLSWSVLVEAARERGRPEPSWRTAGLDDLPAECAPLAAPATLFFVSYGWFVAYPMVSQAFHMAAQGGTGGGRWAVLGAVDCMERSYVRLTLGRKRD